MRLAAGMADDPHAFTDEFFDELSEIYTDAEISELLVFAGIEVGLDRFCIALTLDTAAESHYPTDLEYPGSRTARRRVTAVGRRTVTWRDRNAFTDANIAYYPA